MLLSGKKGLVIGYGDVGKGSAASLAQEGMIVSVVESDPICAMQACMDGFSVVSCYKDGVVTRNAADINMQRNAQSVGMALTEITPLSRSRVQTVVNVNSVKGGC